jgi:HEAT repeat protein
MNELLELLSGGTLQSDGRANKVANEVIRHPERLAELVEGLKDQDDVIRGRTAHALERISRSHPQMVFPLLPHIYDMAIHDSVPMVRWHMVMILANAGLPAGELEKAISVLLQALDDSSVFVKSWAIVSLTILGRRQRSFRILIIDRFVKLQNDKSIAIRSKIRKALDILVNERIPIPPGWIKGSEK